MRMVNEQPRYCSYLLRCWEERTTDEAFWRFSVEDPHTGERQGFASVDALIEFLRATIQECSERNPRAASLGGS